MWPVAWSDAVLLFAAGVLGGLTGSIAGLASVATYPALLLVGLPPVTANVTNTVALVFNGIGSIWGSRPELRGPGRVAHPDRAVRRRGRRRRCGAAVVDPVGGLRDGSCRSCWPSPRWRSWYRCAPADHARVASDRRRTTRLIVEAAAIFAICIYGGLLRRGRGRVAARPVLAGRWRDARSGQRRQERHPRHRERRRGGDLRVPGSGAVARSRGTRAGVPARVAARPHCRPPRTRETDAGRRSASPGSPWPSSSGSTPTADRHTNGLSPLVTRVPRSMRFCADVCSRSPASRLACPAR